MLFKFFMQITRRRMIIELLEDREYSIEELAKLLETDRKTILEDLKHIKKTLRSVNKTLYVVPPFCYKCNKEIIIRDVKNISKCPRCKSTYISKPKFFIK